MKDLSARTDTSEMAERFFLSEQMAVKCYCISWKSIFWHTSFEKLCSFANRIKGCKQFPAIHTLIFKTVIPRVHIVNRDIVFQNMGGGHIRWIDSCVYVVRCFVIEGP